MRTVEVTGKLNRIKFPPLCINCAAEAAEWVVLHKVFTYRDEDSRDETCETNSVRVPACAACAQRHRAELKSIGFLERIVPALKTKTSFAFLLPFVTTLFFLSKAVEDAARLEFTRAAFMMAPVGLFGTVAGILWWQILNRSQQYGVPPDTIVSGTVSFSARKKRLFQPERRRFEFRNDAFATAFIDVNRPALWDPRSPEAISAKNKRTLLEYGFLAVIVAAVLWSALGEYVW